MNPKCIIIYFLLHMSKFINSTHTDSIETNFGKLEDNFAPHSFGSSSSGEEGLHAGNRRDDDHYEYWHWVSPGVQRALDECREKFKWDRWNCPKRAFEDVLLRRPSPSNKEYAITRALIASSIVLSLTRSCSYGNHKFCGCSPMTTSVPGIAVENKHSGHSTPEVHQHSIDTLAALPNTNQQANQISNLDHNLLKVLPLNDSGNEPQKLSKFIWNGCDESIKFAFRVSKTYLETEDMRTTDEASRVINAHNYEVGRLAVFKNLQRMCKCHGVSGSCQVQTCWTTVPNISKIGDYIKRKFRLAAKVGAKTAVESNLVGLNKELAAVPKDKMVFVDASPDYCYENPSLHINGTLGRYCSRNKQRNGTEVSRYERDSCDRLCTECGYRIKREVIKIEKQCSCRFVYCCSIQCKRCPIEEEAYKCVRHS